MNSKVHLSITGEKLLYGTFKSLYKPQNKKPLLQYTEGFDAETHCEDFKNTLGDIDKHNGRKKHRKCF